MIHTVTVISSGKGGSGKSTVAAGLGCAFALRGQRTVILDLNSLCSGAAYYLDAGGSPYHLGDAAEDRCSLWDAIFPCEAIPGLDLTLPPRTAETLPTETTLLQWLMMLSETYGQILVDTPFWSRCFAAATQQAKTTLLVSPADALHISCCDQLRTSPVGQTMRNPRLVINQFHRMEFWKAGEFQDLDQVIDRSGLQLAAVLPTDRNLQKYPAVTMQKTLDYKHLLFSQNGSGGAIALHCLAERLLGQNVPLRNLEWL